ncbi:uncharacterized protein P174DRAFT_489361 [Aspergillus novofumigatus IBT 16806]|uniref:Uncharacterized protein n=1 Tax=Aspergillus novofumigatus (strain IBT 16806) TaxID=1392255 RepID=A0A2I1C5U3_ASPN1|nr:uncharacterized protein P174DRAFT_489361 [Aspergillus novofumigatus IBT 16806]PKX92931.1 hypothetical protein P174DRAFT_489361 [Aspergillus novofumigatus IBT 16806]
MPKVGGNILTIRGANYTDYWLDLAPCYGQQSKSTLLSFMVAREDFRVYTLHHDFQTHSADSTPELHEAALTLQQRFNVNHWLVCSSSAMQVRTNAYLWLGTLLLRTRIMYGYMDHLTEKNHRLFYSSSISERMEQGSGAKVMPSMEYKGLSPKTRGNNHFPRGRIRLTQITNASWNTLIYFDIEFSPKIRVALPTGQKLKVVGHSENCEQPYSAYTLTKSLSGIYPLGQLCLDLDSTCRFP